MGEWKEYKISDIIKLEYGKALKDYSHKAGLYDVFGTNGKIGKTDIYLYDQPSLVIGRKGAYREVHLAQGPFYVIDTAFYTKKIIESLSVLFLYYWFKNININLMDSGSAIPSTSRDEVYDLDIFLPELEEQNKIAFILSSLDKKIDLLHHQNTTLEKMAETIFRQWFIEEAKENWEEKTLRDIANIFIGRTPPRKESEWFSTNCKDIKWVSIKDLGNNGIFINSTAEYLTEDAQKEFNIPLIPKHTVILSFKMTVGRVGITTENMLSNEAIAQFQLKKDTVITKEYLYLFLKRFNYDLLGTTSSIVTSINSALIKDINIIIPDKSTMCKFMEIIGDFFKKIESNQQQIQILTQLRDTLLPKLMSGEIKVTD